MALRNDGRKLTITVSEIRRMRMVSAEDVERAQQPDTDLDLGWCKEELAIYEAALRAIEAGAIQIGGLVALPWLHRGETRKHLVVASAPEHPAQDAHRVDDQHSGIMYRCEECEHTTDDPLDGPVYECQDCGEYFTRDGSYDGESNRCPNCGKFSCRIGDVACPECGAPMVEWGDDDSAG